MLSVGKTSCRMAFPLLPTWSEENIQEIDWRESGWLSGGAIEMLSIGIFLLHVTIHNSLVCINSLEFEGWGKCPLFLHLSWNITCNQCITVAFEGLCHLFINSASLTTPHNFLAWKSRCSLMSGYDESNVPRLLPCPQWDFLKLGKS
jgi:hypothetical protein